MRKANHAQWTKTKKGWQLIVTVERHWEAPKVGDVITVPVFKKGNYRGETTKVRLTSRPFNQGGKLKAFAEKVDG